MKRPAILTLLGAGLLISSCSSPVDPAVTARLQQEADAFNRQSNAVTPSGIRIDSASASGARLRFNFTLVNNGKADFDSTIFAQRARLDVLGSLQTGGNAAFFRDHNVRITYTYYDREGKLVSAIEILPGDYEAIPGAS